MIRQYQPGDETGIITLFEKVFNRPMSQEEWHWKYMQGQHKPIIIVSEDEYGNINGHVAALIYSGRMEDKSLIAGERVDAMVDPDARGKGVYSAIVQKLMSECESRVDVLYGFPAQTAKEVFLKQSGGKEVTSVPRLIRPAALPVPGFSVKEVQVKTLEQDELAVIDQIFEKYESRPAFRIDRTSAHLKWRYLDRPDKDYQIKAVYRSGEVLGYAVVRYEQKKVKGIPLYFTHLIDYFASNDYAELKEFFAYLIKHEQKRSILSLWAMPETAAYEALKNTGFIEVNRPMPLVYQASSDASGKLEKPANWYMTQGDVDSY